MLGGKQHLRVVVVGAGDIAIDQESGFEIELDNEYMMSPKDLCTIGFLDRIADAGGMVVDQITLELPDLGTREAPGKPRQPRNFLGASGAAPTPRTYCRRPAN